MKQLTTETLDRMTDHEDWGGFGYLGERENQRAGMQAVERGPEAAYWLACADDMLLAYANRRGLTEEQLFAWANSKVGRWYGDCWFGANGQHAKKYLPVI